MKQTAQPIPSAESDRKDGRCNMRIFSFLIIYLFTTFGTADLLLAQESVIKIEPGSGDFLFTDKFGNADKPLHIYYYCPDRIMAGTQILFVMHGVSRNGDGYRDTWMKYAEAGGFLMLAPTFDREHYPEGEHYERGYLFDEENRLRPKEQWSYMAIEHLFDAVVEHTPIRRKKYDIYGHSAGAQFVHRLITFVPEARIGRAVAANAGWYTLPDLNEPFPYGLRGAPQDAEGLKAAMAQNLVIMVGSEDTDPNHEDLRHTPQAERQGPHRLARGQYYVRWAREKAEEWNATLKWRVQLVSGAAHSNSKMAEAAAELMFPRVRKSDRKER